MTPEEALNWYDNAIDNAIDALGLTRDEQQEAWNVLFNKINPQKMTNITDNYNVWYQAHDTRVCPPTEKDGVRRRNGKFYVLAWCSDYKMWMIVNIEAVTTRPTFYTYWQPEPPNPEKEELENERD